MTVHIGKIIHDLVKGRGLRTKAVAEGISVSESTIYKIYNRSSIDIDKLIKLSQLLNTNLFEYYLDDEPLKSLFNERIERLNAEIRKLENDLSLKEDHISNLKEIISSQKEVIALLKEAGGKS